MLKPKLLLLAVVTFVTCASSNLTMTSSFKRLGQLTTGLTYGHIHSSIDFAQLQRAQRLVVQGVMDQLRNSNSANERALIEAIKPQLDIATKTIEDLHALFFGHEATRQKRQIFLGIALALGLVSAGTSIYATTEVTRLHHELTNLRSDFKHIAQVLTTDAHAVNQLTENFRTLSKTCQLLLGKQNLNEQKISTTMTILGLHSLVGNLNAQLSAWRTGLDALANGKLHPALIDHGKLKLALFNIEEKAKTSGRRLLHDDGNAIFKAPVSYLATDKGAIVLIIHVPLIDHEPMDLFEFVPTPIKVRNLYLEITTTNKILAFDKLGQQGKELSHSELLRCHSEDWHNGRIFVCPDANLLRNDIRKTCLGSIFFNVQKVMEDKCDHLLNRGNEENVRQVSQTEILVHLKEETTMTERCSNGTSYRNLKEGLTRLSTNPGCTLVTRDFTFRSLADISIDETFVRQEIRTTKLRFLESKSDVEIQEALTALSDMKLPETIRTDDIEAWLSNQHDDRWMNGFHWSTTALVAGISVSVALAILYLFLKYKKAQTSN